MKLNFGIREKLLIPLIMGLLVIFCVLFLFWQPSHLVKAKQQFIESQTKILKTLNPSIIQNILANDLSELHRVLENSLIIHKNEWRYIQLINVDNKILYPVFGNEPEKKNTLLKIELDIIENDELYGVLYLQTDWETHKNKEIENINQLSYASLILFSIIAIFSFILQTKWVYNPITKLKNITSQISQGNYDVKLPNISTDEIGLLSKSIDQMRNKINATLNEIINKEKMQRAILETAPDAIITMNSNGTINSFNPGAENIFGFKASEIIGQNIKILMPDDFASQHDFHISNFKPAEKSRAIGKKRNLEGMKKDGSTFPVEITLNTKKIDGEMLFTGVLRDITERRKIDRLKSEFVSTVSHELRTPLTAIKGSLDILTKGLNLELPEQANNMLDIANRNVERLLILINDILDTSKLESGEINFNFEKLEINEFIQNSILINQEYAKKHNTIFKCTHCHSDISVTVDKDRLEQVMSNLLSNAAKYSPVNVPVEIYTTINDKNIRINVKDYGPGIPHDFKDKVFEKFTQSSSGDTRQVGGTGLGLNISKMIIEKFNGNIGFETLVGKGSTFYFEIPIVNKL